MFEAIVQTFLSPITTILTTARDNLDSVALVAGRGLNLDYYLGPVMMLGPGWQVFITSVLSSAFLLLVVLTARKGFGLYLALKQGVKWW